VKGCPAPCQGSRAIFRSRSAELNICSGLPHPPCASVKLICSEFRVLPKAASPDWSRSGSRDVTSTADVCGVVTPPFPDDLLIGVTLAITKYCVSLPCTRTDYFVEDEKGPFGSSVIVRNGEHRASGASGSEAVLCIELPAGMEPGSFEGTAEGKKVERGGPLWGSRASSLIGVERQCLQPGRSRSLGFVGVNIRR